MAKNISTYIVGFFLTICVFILTSLLIFSNTAFNKGFALKALEENNYYEKTYLSIKSDFENYILQSGLEKSDLEGVCTLEQVTADVIQVINAIYENKEVKISTNAVVEKIDNRINEILKENNRTPEKEEKEAIKSFEEAIAEAYEDNIVFSKKYVEEAGNVFEKASNFIEKGIMLASVVVAILVITIVLINRNFRDIMKAIGTSLIATGALAVLLKLLVENKIQNILFLSATFSKTVISMLNYIINTFYISGICMVIIGLLAILLGCVKTKNKQENNETMEKV